MTERHDDHRRRHDGPNPKQGLVGPSDNQGSGNGGAMGAVA